MQGFAFSKRLIGFCLSTLMFGGILIAAPAMAASGCQADGGGSKCQYRFQSGDNGDVYGSRAAPVTTISQGIRQDHGTANILYNNYIDLCRFVDNNHPANDYFIPQGTAPEFADVILNPPNSVVIGYCTQATTAYSQSAQLPNGFWIAQAGGPAQLPASPTYTAAAVNLPLTRVGSSSPQQAVTLPIYTRYDCIAGTTSPTAAKCNARVIAEYQTITVATSANSSATCRGGQMARGQNCDGSWGASTIVSFYCTVDGVQHGTGMPSCLADYDPPAGSGKPRTHPCGLGPTFPDCPPSPCGGSGPGSANDKADLC